MEFIPIISVGRHSAFPYDLRGSFMLSDTGMPFGNPSANVVGRHVHYFQFKGGAEVIETSRAYLEILERFVIDMAAAVQREGLA